MTKPKDRGGKNMGKKGNQRPRATSDVSGGQPTDIERGYEVGLDEAMKANMKMIVAEELANLTAGKTNASTHFNRMTTNALSEDATRNALATLGMAQAITNNNLITQVGTAILGIFGDRVHNLDEVSKLAAQQGTAADALHTVVITKLAQLLGTTPDALSQAIAAAKK